MDSQKIPNKYMENDIYYIYKKHEDMTDVVIPPKWNKFGKRFGFVRFNEVKDERILIIILDMIFIDNEKIHANVPRVAGYSLHLDLLIKSKVNHTS